MERQMTVTAIPDAVPERLPPFPIPARASDKQKTSLKTGQFLDTDNATQRAYWAFVPEDYNPAFDYGLLVWIAPAGAPMEGELLSAWKAECEQRGLIRMALSYGSSGTRYCVVHDPATTICCGRHVSRQCHSGLILFAPRAERARGWLPDDAEVIYGMVERLRERYAIDANRIVVHGYSDGGMLAAHLAFKHRELFRGLILASSAPRMVVPENRPGLRFQVLFVCGDKEEVATSVEQTAEGLRRVKYPVSLIRFESTTARYPPGATVQAAARWCDMLDRM
jgi:serine protease Do